MNRLDSAVIFIASITILSDSTLRVLRSYFLLLVLYSSSSRTCVKMNLFAIWIGVVGVTVHGAHDGGRDDEGSDENGLSRRRL